MAAGLLTLWRRRSELLPGARSRLAGAILIGAGGFNLYDGTVQHKLLKLHQVREEANPQTPYDVGFIAIAVVVLALGLWLYRGRSPASPPP